jgi:hypothetical protein
MKSSTAVVFLLALVTMLQAKGQEDEDQSGGLRAYSNGRRKPCLEKHVLVGGFATGFIVKVDRKEKKRGYDLGQFESGDLSEGEDLSEEVADDAGISEGDLNALFEGAGLPGMPSQGDVLSAVVASGLISEGDLSGVDTGDLSAVVDGAMISEGDDVAA